MANPIIRIHNAETDEIIDREMTADELAIHQESHRIDAARKLEQNAKAAEKAALLDKLGITADEAALLLG
jgi:hypothetical protein